MILLPELQVTATSNIKASYCKTIQVLRTDNTFTATKSGVNLVKATIPADATLQDFQIWTGTGSNAGTSANLYVGAIVPFTSISSTTTTATVVTPVLHNLVTGDTIVVNGTGQANFDQATPVSITVTNSTTFTYTITSTNATSIIGNIGCTSYFLTPTSALNTTQVVPAVGASPFAYTVPAYGNLVISSGTVSAVTITRAGQSAVNIGVVAGMVPVQAGDVVTVTYTVAPVMTFIPADRSAVGYLITVTKRVGPPNVGWVNAATGTAGVPIGTDLQVFAMYKETGTASSSGGPWFITIWYVR
jgi:hypothetical protein